MSSDCKIFCHKAFYLLVIIYDRLLSPPPSSKILCTCLLLKPGIILVLGSAALGLQCSFLITQLCCWDRRQQHTNINSPWLVLQSSMIFQGTTENYYHPTDMRPYFRMSPVRLLSIMSLISCLQPFYHPPFHHSPSITAFWILSNNTDCNLPFLAYFLCAHSIQQQVRKT